jgi:hypothetical protein
MTGVSTETLLMAILDAQSALDEPVRPTPLQVAEAAAVTGLLSEERWFKAAVAV